MRRVSSVAALALMVGSAWGIDLGADAPAWSNLPGTDGKNHSLQELKDAKAVVVAFTCNHCPVAVAYEDRFIAFAKEYQKKGVAFVAISVNKGESDQLPAMIERAKEKDFPFPYIYDESQKIGHDFQAEKTPHLFVLDKDRKIAYVGSFDDKMAAEKVETHFVKDAVDAILAGKKPAVQTHPAHGCGIRYE
ncbi:thioredoxin family protein [bacterium]|nr:thioredoxin family protein [bacterium]